MPGDQRTFRAYAAAKPLGTCTVARSVVAKLSNRLMCHRKGLRHWFGRDEGPSEF